ncbi:hypothetical protein GE09DRAFT_1209055 [Coniochaeta sp. 2T2.1]|nr:hypothetical protein GE09DRAFT_1209055 [Coniochaeta sp. 2T2.1]
MGLFKTTALLAAIGSAMAVPTPEAQDIAATTKYCDAASTVCYSEFTSTNNIAFRIAIPDTATASAPFDVLLQIVAPKAIGWAAIAWGGQMAYNPLTVAWPNGASVVVSSRRATAHTLPGVYTGATYTVLPTSATNTTHWKLDVLAQGVSTWTDASGKAASLNPSGTAVPLAWGSSSRAVATPANNASSFAGHDAKGKFSHDLNSAKVADFNALVAKLQGTGA